jgi:hypothetical protein
MADKRKFPRLADNCRLKYQIINYNNFEQRKLDAAILNVSGGGIQFTVREGIATNTLLAIEMQGPAFENPVIAIANTIHCDKRRNDDMYDIGCEFWWIGWRNNEIQKSIADYITERTHNSKNEACVVDH